jgi:hypothetical protein
VSSFGIILKFGSFPKLIGPLPVFPVLQEININEMKNNNVFSLVLPIK